MPDYRIRPTMCKHHYSANVCAKFVFPILPKLGYIMQYFMLFPMMTDRKLGHKLTNVKTARVNKVVIAFVYRITWRKHLYSARSVFLIVLKLNYIVQYFMLFLMTYSKLGYKLTNAIIYDIN